MSICFHNNLQYNLDTLEITLSNKIQKNFSKYHGELNGKSPLVCIYREGKPPCQKYQKNCSKGQGKLWLEKAH